MPYPKLFNHNIKLIEIKHFLQVLLFSTKLLYKIKSYNRPTLEETFFIYLLKIKKAARDRNIFHLDNFLPPKEEGAG